MQGYIADDNSYLAPIGEIRPNLKKIFLKNLITILIFLLVLIGLGIYLEIQVGFDSFAPIFETFQIVIDPTQLIIYTVVILFFLAFFLLMGSYLASKNVRYVLYDDKIVFKTTQALIMVNSAQIPLQNITRVYYKSDSLMNKLLNYGDIYLEISGMREGNIKAECIDDVKNTTEYIQRLLNEFHSFQQMRYQQNQNINTIMRKF